MNKAEVRRLLSEDLLSLADARRAFPGKQPDKASLIRWITLGVGPRRTKLEGVRLGQQWFVTRQSIERFIVARTKDAVPS